MWRGFVGLKRTRPNDRVLSEREAISVFYSVFGMSPRSAIPFGDDVSAVPVKDDLFAILKTDMFVRKTDAPKGMTFKQMGRKAVVSTVSDFAAKGVEPLTLLSSLAFPRSFTSSVIEELAAGLNEASREYGAAVIGGDTNEAEDLVIDVIGFGLARREDIVLRSGAKAGDIAATTGTFGEVTAGLRILQEDLPSDGPLHRSFVNAAYMPRAQLREGLALSRSRTVTSSIDSSDGLAWSLHELSRSSRVGFTVTDIPLGRNIDEFAAETRADPYDLALYGGEEFNLVFTVDEKRWNEAVRAVESVGGQVFNIGYATERLDVVVRREGKEVPIRPAGWEHFITEK